MTAVYDNRKHQAVVKQFYRHLKVWKLELLAMAEDGTDVIYVTTEELAHSNKYAFTGEFVTKDNSVARHRAKGETVPEVMITHLKTVSETEVLNMTIAAATHKKYLTVWQLYM
jgi:hypothetical protein